MRTATITFHAPNNNGSFFQAYALQKVVIDQIGVQNVIIDFQTEKQIHQYSVLRPAKSIRDIAKNIVSLLHYRKLTVRNTRFEEMREKYLRLSERCSEADQAIELANNYDLVIAGSDQIWNTGAPDFSSAYLLPGIKTKKISYAVSLGSYSTEANLKQYKSAIQEFSYISVREATAKRFLTELLGRSIDLTCDPTLLLNKADYEEMMDPKPLIGNDYLFFYSINYHPQVLETARKISEQLQLPVITAFTSFHTIICEKYGLKVVYDAGPSEFLNLLVNAKGILTNSFHGTAFSIIFEKPLLHICDVVDGSIKRDDRIDDCLDTLGMTSCNCSINSASYSFTDIPWDSVREKREEMRNHAINFLRIAVCE